MDIRKVKKLIEMLENSNLEEIEIQEGEESVRLVKGNGRVSNSSMLNQRPCHKTPPKSSDESEPETIKEEDKDGNFINLAYGRNILCFSFSW